MRSQYSLYLYDLVLKRIFFIFLVCLFSINLIAQNNVGIKLFGLSIHPKGERANAFLMPRKLDKNAYLVMNVGGILSYEHFVFRDILSIKTANALYSDCAARLGGFFHIGIRGTIIKSGRHVLNGGIGPTLVFRRNWLELDGYVNPNRFKGGLGEKWQYLFLWYGGEFEYKYALNKKIDFAVSFVPGYPDLMNLSMGINYKF